MDDLHAFGSEREEAAKQARRGDTVELLVITQGALLLAIEATHVESVVSFQTPAVLPQASPWVSGIIQDRGRLVAVRKTEHECPQVSRIVLCNTSRGLIGIPASETRSIGQVCLSGPVGFFTPIDSDVGALTILDPEELARQMTDE